jgi:hypothetical protein
MGTIAATIKINAVFGMIDSGWEIFPFCSILMLWHLNCAIDIHTPYSGHTGAFSESKFGASTGRRLWLAILF